jgi:hypothetical protein
MLPYTALTNPTLCAFWEEATAVLNIIYINFRLQNNATTNTMINVIYVMAMTILLIIMNNTGRGKVFTQLAPHHKYVQDP